MNKYFQDASTCWRFKSILRARRESASQPRMHTKALGGFKVKFLQVDFWKTTAHYRLLSNLLLYTPRWSRSPDDGSYVGGRCADYDVFWSPPTCALSARGVYQHILQTFKGVISLKFRGYITNRESTKCRIPSIRLQFYFTNIFTQYQFLDRNVIHNLVLSLNT